MKKRSSLERKMLSYFGLIAAASLLITVEFVLAIRQAAIHANALESGSTVVHVLESLRYKAVLMCVVQAVVTLIVLIMFIRRITGPLQSMVEQAEVISQGDLSQTIRVPGKDEIALLAETINGLTSNIQEIVGLSLSTDLAVRSLLADLHAQLHEQPEAHEQLGEIEVKLDQLRSFMEEFKLLQPPMATVRQE
jgi:methyl-accepting chemotaxis protein